MALPKKRKFFSGKDAAKFLPQTLNIIEKPNYILRTKRIECVCD